MNYFLILDDDSNETENQIDSNNGKKGLRTDRNHQPHIQGHSFWTTCDKVPNISLFVGSSHITPDIGLDSCSMTDIFVRHF